MLKKLYKSINNFVKLTYSTLVNSKLYSNSILLMTDRLLVTGFGFIFWLIATRFYSPQNIGIANTLISTMTLILLISLFGIDETITRFLPTFKRKKEFIFTLGFITLCSTLIISLIFLFTINIISDSLGFLSQNINFAIIFIIGTLSWQMFNFLDPIMIAQRKNHIKVLKNLSYSILKVIFLIILINYSTIGIFIAYTIPTLIVILFFVQKINLKTILIFKQISKYWKFSFSNYFVRLFTMSTGLLLPLIISNYLDFKQVAFFSIPWYIVSVVYVIPKVIAKSLLVEASYTQHEFAQNLKKSLKISLFSLLPVTTIIAIFSKFILGIYGSIYLTNSKTLLYILLATSIFVLINEIYTTILKKELQLKKLILLWAFIFIGTISLSIFFIKYSLTGIGVAWFISQGLASIYSLPQIYYKMKNEN